MAQKKWLSAAMPWRCAFESPLPQRGHLDPGLCDPSLTRNASQYAAIHAAEVEMVRRPTGKLSAPQNNCIDNTSMIENHSARAPVGCFREPCPTHPLCYRFAGCRTRTAEGKSASFGPRAAILLICSCCGNNAGWAKRNAGPPGALPILGGPTLRLTHPTAYNLARQRNESRQGSTLPDGTQRRPA